MRRRVSWPSPTQLGFWPFLLWWSFEHMTVGRPLPIGGPFKLPRALQWPRPSARSLDLLDFVTFHSQLELVTADTIIWEHFAYFQYRGEYDVEFHMSLRRWHFYSFTSWELYMGDHCWRQMIGEIRIPRCRFSSTFGQASSQAAVPMEVVTFMAEGDYTAWFRSVSIGRFTSTT